MAEASVQPEASIASTGLGLRYIGQHAYAYSGVLNTLVSVAFSDMLDFTTGAGVIDGKFTFTGPMDITTPTAGNTGFFRIKFNDIDIGYINVDTAQEDMQSWVVTPIIIPPFTHVKVAGASTNDGYQSYCWLTGRVYGAE